MNLRLKSLFIKHARAQSLLLFFNLSIELKTNQSDNNKLTRILTINKKNQLKMLINK